MRKLQTVRARCAVLLLMLCLLLCSCGMVQAETEDPLRARYDEAYELYKSKDYAAASTIYQELGTYRDSRYMLKDCNYRLAIHLHSEGEHTQALALFEELGSYERSKNYAYQCRMAILQADYECAVALLDAGDLEGALELFDTLGSYRHGDKRADEIRQMILERDKAAEEKAYFEQGMEKKQSGDYAAARDFFIEAGNHEGATEQVYEMVSLLAQQKGQSVDHLPVFTATQLRDDRTTPMSPTFTAPDGSTHRYRIYKGVPTWDEARAFCEVLGGHLATLTTPEENMFVYRFMRDNGFLTAFFGLIDEDRSGDWQWVTGEPFEYVNWHPGEPSYSPRERYGMWFYKHTDGTWNDSHFYEHAKVDPGCSFVCEWDD